MNPREEAYKLLHEGILALAEVERSGIRIDLDYVQRMKLHLTRKIEKLEREFKSTKFYRRWEHTVKGKVNINSSVQLAHYLYGTLKLKTERLTTSGQYSTDEDSLLSLNIPELNNLVKIRKLRKIRDTYLEAFEQEQVNGYIHPFFNLHLVTTYSSSSDSPNLQNIPKRDEEAMQICRRAFYPRPGHQLLEVDFKGMEVSISACYTHDPTMIRYLRNTSSDMHSDMARQLFLIDQFDRTKVGHNILRQAAKNSFVFPQFYGDYYRNCAVGLCNWVQLSTRNSWKKEDGIKIDNTTIAEHLISKKINSYQSFEEHVKKIEDDFWKNRFPVYAQWKERQWNNYKKHGYIDFLTGFRCSGVMSKNEVLNAPIQGTAFHCLLWSLIQLNRKFHEECLDSRIINQIHDSMLIDLCPTELKKVISLVNHIVSEELPKTWDWIIVPMQVDMEICQVDESWAEKKELKIV